MHWREFTLLRNRRASRFSRTVWKNTNSTNTISIQQNVQLGTTILGKTDFQASYYPIKTLKYLLIVHMLYCWKWKQRTKNKEMKKICFWLVLHRKCFRLLRLCVLAVWILHRRTKVFVWLFYTRHFSPFKYSSFLPHSIVILTLYWYGNDMLGLCHCELLCYAMITIIF